MSMFAFVFSMLWSVAKVHGALLNLRDPHTTIQFVAKCAIIQVDEDDCIINSFVSIVSKAKTEQNDSYSTMLDECGPPRINYSQLNYYFNLSQIACDVPGSTLTMDKAQESLWKISQILTSHDCWASYCQEQERYNAVENLKTRIIDFVAPCSNITIDPNSCLVSSSLTSLSEKLLEGTNLHTSHNDSSTAQGDHPIMIIPNIKTEDILYSTIQGSAECLSKGVHYDMSEIERTYTTLTELCASPTCWSQGDRKFRNVTGDVGTSNTLVRVYLEQIMMCAGIEIDESSCVENTALDHWNSLVADWSPQSQLSFLDTFHPQTFGDACNIPFMGSTDMERLIILSADRCKARGLQPNTTEIQNALQKLHMLMQSRSCWHFTCDPQLKSRLKYTWLQQCSNVRLPQYLTQPLSLMHKPQTEATESVLGCMIDFIVSSQPSSSGFFDFKGDEPTDMCVPPMFSQRISHYCSITIGPEALSSCYNGPASWDFSMSYALSDEYSLSYSYSSLATLKPKSNTNGIDFPSRGGYSLSYSYAQRFPKINSEALISELCQIFDLWSSDQGKTCFQQLCDVEEGERSSTDPSLTRATFSPTSSVRTMSPITKDFYQTKSPMRAEASSSRPSLKKTSEPSPSSRPTEVNLTNGSTLTSRPSKKNTLIPSKPSLSPPSRRPTAVKFTMESGSSSSSRPSKKSTLMPSTKVVTSLSLLPTYNPTSIQRRTSAPALPQGKGVIAVIVQAKMSLNNFNETQIPAPGPERINMVRVLEIAIDKTLPLGAKSRVLRLGSISVARRLLRELSAELPIDFEVTVSQVCDDATCTKSSSVVDDLYSNITSSLKDSVSSGEISREINSVAMSQNVTILKEASLDTQSFVAVSKQVTVTESSSPSSIVTSSSNHIRKGLRIFLVASIGLLVILIKT